jgi:hypothetical protein
MSLRKTSIGSYNLKATIYVSEAEFKAAEYAAKRINEAESSGGGTFVMTTEELLVAWCNRGIYQRARETQQSQQAHIDLTAAILARQANEVAA